MLTKCQQKDLIKKKVMHHAISQCETIEFWHEKKLDTEFRNYSHINVSSNSKKGLGGACQPQSRRILEMRGIIRIVVVYLGYVLIAALPKILCKCDGEREIVVCSDHNRT